MDATGRRRLSGAYSDDGLRRSALDTLYAAVALAVANANEDTLEAIVCARDNPGQALAAASRDLATVPPERLAAQREAKGRTVQFRAEIANKAGGMLGPEDVANLFGVTVAAVAKQRQRHQILGVPYGQAIRFPASQFKDGVVIPGLEPILTAFGDMNPWGQLAMLVAPLEGFGDAPASILEILTRGVDQDELRQLTSLARSWA